MKTMRNLTMMTDLYQLTMMNGYLHHGMQNSRACFDLFYRRQGEMTAYTLAAGLEQAIEYIRDLHFSDEDIAYLRSVGCFDEEFLAYLRDLRFTGDIWAVPEGTVVFPMEPILRVTAPIIEAQLVETTLLNIIGHQTLIATKAARVVHAAGDGAVLEFGLRRAQGPDAGIYGARAAMIGGCRSTSNVLTGEMFGAPVSGTHAHSWVMSFPDELTAFRAYAKFFPDACLLLVDTFNVLKSGMPHAIQVFKELRAAGHEPLGIRIDSGDLAYLSREARRMMDEAGFPNAKVCVSGDLDEYLINDLKQQGARIDIWGVGTKLITSSDCPALGGVYKLAAEIIDGHVVNKMKVTENPAKVTNPGIKKLLRLYDENGMAVADLIALQDEEFDESKPLTIFDPVDTWKEMTLTNYHIRNLHEPLFVNGQCVYKPRKLMDIQADCKKDLATFWDQYKRLTNPHRYKVDLSEKLWMMKQSMLKNA